MESSGNLRHLAFFEELAKIDESDPHWRSVSAGLVVMRLVDEWITVGADALREDSWSLSAVREAISDVPETTPLRRILLAIVDSRCVRVNGRHARVGSPAHGLRPVAGVRRAVVARG